MRPATIAVLCTRSGGRITRHVYEIFFLFSYPKRALVRYVEFLCTRQKNYHRDTEERRSHRERLFLREQKKEDSLLRNAAIYANKQFCRASRHSIFFLCEISAPLCLCGNFFCRVQRGYVFDGLVVFGCRQVCCDLVGF